MKYPAVLIKSDEGYAAGCPVLSGYWTQGATRAEAIENITITIREILEVKAELEAEQWRREGEIVESAQVDVPVYA
jgi:predicted RNase H-like HicB family nuclease